MTRSKFNSGLRNAFRSNVRGLKLKAVDEARVFTAFEVALVTNLTKELEDVDVRLAVSAFQEETKQ